MLRSVLAGLIVLNALFFGWTQGWLDEVVGIKARGDREPERLARQLHPEQVQLLAVPAVEAPTPVAAAQLNQQACLALGPLDSEAALAAAVQALTQAGVAPGDWKEQSSEAPGETQKTWAVATIRLTSKDFLARKEATYKSMKIAYEFLSSPADEQPTLVLSRHASEKAAAAALENFSQRALKGLRILPLQTPVRHHSLVFAEADAQLQAKLAAAPLLAASLLKPCAAAAAPAPSSPTPAPSASSR